MMKNTKMFTMANGEHAFLINSRNYKGHVIEKFQEEVLNFIQLIIMVYIII